MSEATTTDAKPWRWLLYAMVGIPVLALVSCGVMLLTASGDKTVDASDAQARQLADHDIIEIAGTKMEFFLKR